MQQNATRKNRAKYRQFSDAEKSAALAQLAANCRDFELTAASANVPEYLLRRWAIGQGVAVRIFAEFVGRQTDMIAKMVSQHADALKR